jgi:hypothetical protein
LHAGAPVILTQKSILNLRVDAMEPLLGPVGSFLTSCKLRFQLRDPIFGRVQLMRKLLRYVERTFAVFFGNASRSVEQLQDRLTRLVELIGPIRRAAAGSPRTTPDLTMHRSALSTEVDKSYRVEAFVCCASSPLYGFHGRLFGCVANEQRNRQQAAGN